VITRCANQCRKEKTQVEGNFLGDVGKKRNPSKSKCDSETCWAYFVARNHLVHFYYFLCRGRNFCLRYHFLRMFCIPNPFSCLLIPIYYFASLIYRLQALFYFIFVGLKYCYRCAFSASGKGEITIRGGRVQFGLWILQLAIIPYLSLLFL
jgi:hypothetical protein